MGCCCNSSDIKTSKIVQAQQIYRFTLDSNVFEGMVSSSIFSQLANADERVRQLMEQIMLRYPEKRMSSVRRLFKASESGFQAAAFHKECDGKTNTIVVALSSERRIFGGYTPCTWLRERYYKYSTDQEGSSFLFKASGQAMEFFRIKEEERGMAIMNHEENGPIFGEGHDLYISDRCNIHYCWSNIGKSYSSKTQAGQQLVYGTIKANKLLAGQEKYRLADYQVWQVVF